MLYKRSMAEKIIEYTVKFLFKAWLRIFHRLEVRGLENIPRDGRKLIVISNHASYFDGPALWAFLGLDVKMLVNRMVAESKILRPFLNNYLTVLIDPLNSASLKQAIEHVDSGEALLIFPEGRVTTTGALMKVYDGTGFIAYRTGASLLPVHIEGTKYLLSAKAPVKKRYFNKVVITIGKPRGPIEVKSVSGKDKRKEASSLIYTWLAETTLEAVNNPVTVGRHFIDTCKKYGKKTAFTDATNSVVSYKKSLLMAFLLGDMLDKRGNVGIMLPNLNAAVLAFFGLQMKHKPVSFLNYSGGKTPLLHCMEIAEINTVLTSKVFLGKINMDASVFQGRKVIYLEDLKASFKLADKLNAMFKSWMPNLFLKAGPSSDTAAILFTSGSEGMPKGVCLSHDNLITNIRQAVAKIDIRETDHLMNALPIFHSFGLTVGTLLPFFSGAKTFLYVSPLHYRVVPEISYDQNCTILLGTNTFLSGFARKAHVYDFYSIRYIFCGAEALNDKTFDKYVKDFGIRVLTGYGATECSPVVTMNTALEHEYGTVGRPLPGIECRLSKVEGIEEANTGRLFVRGKNIMKGYLKKGPGTEDGWYDTGDIVEINSNGYLRIAGRLKRFAKISGEMVSLSAVEEAVQSVLPERKEAAIIAVADEKKGEKLVVFVTDELLELKALKDKLGEMGLSELAKPKELHFIKALPKLGTGKCDYIKLKEQYA